MIVVVIALSRLLFGMYNTWLQHYCVRTGAVCRVSGYFCTGSSIMLPLVIVSYVWAWNRIQCGLIRAMRLTKDTWLPDAHL